LLSDGLNSDQVFNFCLVLAYFFFQVTMKSNSSALVDFNQNNFPLPLTATSLLSSDDVFTAWIEGGTTCHSHDITANHNHPASNHSQWTKSSPTPTLLLFHKERINIIT